MLKIQVDPIELSKAKEAYGRINSLAEAAKTLSDTLGKLQEEFKTFLDWAESGESPTKSNGALITGKATAAIPGYNPDASWRNKIEQILRHFNRPVTTTDIVNLMLELEPAMRDKRDRAVGAVSAILSSKSNRDKYSSRKNDKNQYEYSLIKKERMMFET